MLPTAAAAAESVGVLISVAAAVVPPPPSTDSFLDFLVGFVTMSWLPPLLADDDDDGLVMVGVGDESNGVSYGDVRMTDAPGVVVSAFRFTPFFVCHSRQSALKPDAI